jgi:DegV family protein with EDD domain
MFKIFSDSACDLGDSLLLKRNIGLIPFYISFDKTNYYKERTELKTDEFYKTLREEHILPKTSLPSVLDYIDAFTPALEAGNDVICFCLSAKFSGSITSAINAKSVLAEQFPARKIEIIDSRNATAGQALIVLEAANMRDGHFSFDDVVNISIKISNDTKIIFTVDSLEYLEKGGRVGKAGALASAILNIKPIILLDNGELLPIAKCRGRKKSLIEVLLHVNKHMAMDTNKYNFIIMHSDVYDEATEFNKMAFEKYSIECVCPLLDIGVTIGSHTGRTALGVAFSPKYTNYL